MARVTLYLPDELAARIRHELPGLNISRALREALVERLACRHDELACPTCAAVMVRAELVDDALCAFYAQAWAQLGELAARAGTAEGAVAILRRVAEDFGLSKVARFPLVRSTVRARRAAQDAKVRDLVPPPPRRRIGA